MRDTDFTLDALVDQVHAAGGDIDADYVVFGSTVLWLHGLRAEVGDVDVFVAREVWDRWRGDGWRVLEPRVGDPPFLELPLDPPIHAFYAWTARDEWMDVGRCFELAEEYLGVRCIPLSEVRRHKTRAHADPKHLADVRAIDGAA